ncbi:VIT1/CCC1 transporter family protein [Cryptosporangium aurantiacum]|uniref:Predicted Fe2+/Mn2+ transporter, VIT1/CCC1 family n=1 Tax=Cryptosporangium aurantiacum TaxID=134849 RepID=A0A1M7IMZ2_9ACTN|nr:VIT1/CCC1 transporter family protein [Cryptosporangium aurantiacum]SHM42182.1 Predicted Fe2+/Mn2+ transporter, VIT1/CCC1 family [Cryptosporangium aurantiacum]
MDETPPTGTAGQIDDELLLVPHHGDVSGGWLRAAVFGAMDGLVTNISLIAGVGGGGVDRHTIILTGIAGTVAGAVSMALGEYTSVRTQNEQLDAEVAKERRELRLHGAAEQRELVLLLQRAGLSPGVSQRIADEAAGNPDLELRLHALTELGVIPEEKPSPWTAAASSFVCFAVGALIPLLSFLLGSDELWLALLIGGAGLFVAGVLATRATAGRWWVGGLRQLLLGAAAAGVTYLVGRLIGATVS